jgi:hypothetical protein
METSIGIFSAGFILVAFFFKNLIDFINIKILGIPLLSDHVNDLFQLWLRICLSYSFGVLYFMFRAKRSKTIFSISQTISLTVGLMLLIIVIDVCEMIIVSRFLHEKHIPVSEILPLWLTFPLNILFVYCFFNVLSKRKPN